MGWLKSTPNDSCCREAGHATPTIGWLKQYPNDSCRRETGHMAPKIGWLKEYPNDSFCREAGHATPTIGWLKPQPNDSCCREAGHDAVFTVISDSNTSRLSLGGQTTDPRLAADECAFARRHPDPDRTPTADLCCRTSIGSAHVKPKACTTGTRLEMPTSGLRLLVVVCDWLGNHKLGGVCRLTRTCKVWTLLHAPQTSSDTSCSSSVDTY
ncbi:unnamed protein product, partial [Ectocarpus sp. 12 AP-2014]